MEASSEVIIQGEPSSPRRNSAHVRNSLRRHYFEHQITAAEGVEESESDATRGEEEAAGAGPQDGEDEDAMAGAVVPGPKDEDDYEDMYCDEEGN